jgi:hypothetical protein
MRRPAGARSAARLWANPSSSRKATAASSATGQRIGASSLPSKPSSGLGELSCAAAKMSVASLARGSAPSAAFASRRRPPLSTTSLISPASASKVMTSADQRPTARAPGSVSLALPPSRTRVASASRESTMPVSAVAWARTAFCRGPMRVGMSRKASVKLPGHPSLPPSSISSQEPGRVTCGCTIARSSTPGTGSAKRSSPGPSGTSWRKRCRRTTTSDGCRADACKRTRSPGR